MTEAMKLTGMNYASLSAIFFREMNSQYMYPSFSDETPESLEWFAIHIGVREVWDCGWRDGCECAGVCMEPEEMTWEHGKAGEYPDAISYRDAQLEDIFYRGMKDGYAAARDTDTDSEIVCKAALQYALSFVYEQGYVDAQRVAREKLKHE